METKLLASIQSPKDMRNWSILQLEELAKEIRRVIIETTAQTGGHIGASLGAVELAIALHYAYDTPQDKLIWDIGHQAYAHKLLTGRYQTFSTLRQLNGLSGFLKRRESEYDVWEAGHASTSLSAAMGIASARDLRHQKYRIVAVIGDGALTAGMAWEALNQIGQTKTNLVIVVNDNSMSIAPNVGAFSRYLTELRSAPAYTRMKQEIEQLLDSIPVFGGPLRKTIERVKDLLHHAVLPRNVFEELGFKYYGPIDGHNLSELIPVLRNAQLVDGPVVVHVITQKGRGYRPAEERPGEFHGPGPFEIQSGQFIKKPQPPSYSQVFSQTLIELAKTHPEIVAITAAMPDGTKLDLFQKAFPDRFFDVGIAEQHAATFAAGLAIGGMRPVFAVYSTFLQRAYDQVIHDICHQDLPVILGVDRAGIVGGDGATHQGVYDISFLRAVPNMEIAMGKDERELRQLLVSALDRPHPVALRYPRGASRGLDLTEPLKPLPWGQGEWLAHGGDATIIAIGPMVYHALTAREILAEEGYDIGVVNARFIKPLDTALLRQVVQETRAIVTLEEHVVAGGFGSAINEWLNAEAIELPILNAGLPDEFIDHGSASYYLNLYELNAEGLARRVRTWLPQTERAKK
ncbi:1-deoxy-D-xylulose-5-phosphate synthase [Sulfobacillus thermosulfidooxidans]|uniref:1-deoxy-D-xylulose-5-phosphate synthase n=1 Tax=Sulfobacillus thermosulfidooxidans TaxID=28034 RepID=UPI00096BB866|nr:1-deoxy-D-xylulose-5-phosphate synthase [Sulfobacillus thermosulfidooxidans]OLZ08534.1 1-deoxy-D-xylulose-5-phosphate synthase [Sulfobacillus thermosulfidooxidans]OLZ13136.1 1-deoxy-D-xylulose-5-phosphate synthase [Sulfobacillus thermosulfidooxidans]OLZ21516.1 1-deoxy-D-xylulose-5-phosphate synthase [Sulfobacillus thermosulfidooxidans]